MSGIKNDNIAFWTMNVPGIDNDVHQKEVGSPEFYRKVDEVRYRQEPYLEGFFSELIVPGAASLEVGIGLGTDLRTFAKAGMQVTGLDYSPGNAHLSQQGLDACDLKGKVVSGDAEQLPFPDTSFDICYSWGCLHHSPETRKSIDELYRVLKPGGSVMVMLYHKGYQYLYMLLAYILTFRWLSMPLQRYISWRYDSAPLSQMFSRKELFDMFGRFDNVQIRVVNFGGIQSHPVLKHLWRLFQIFPALEQRIGSFAIITAKKPGEAPALGVSPVACCSLCRTPLTFGKDAAVCENTSCGATFPIHEGKVPVLHPNAQEVYKNFLTS